MFLILGFAFLAGVVTVLSPCILPLMPIILSSANGVGKQKPIGVVIGFVSSFTFFTLFLSTIVRVSGVPADSLRLVSIVVLFLFGLSMLVPVFQKKIEIFFSRFANLVPNGQKKGGIVGGIVVGVSLGLLWTPCVGPILASVISLAITGTVTTEAFLITLAYASGTAIPMFLIMMAGATALKKVSWLVRNGANIQRGFGVLMIITAVGIFFNIDRRFQTFILETFPNYGVGLTGFEDNDNTKKELEKINQKNADDMIGKITLDINKGMGIKGPELIEGGEWFNSSPLTLEALKGKVVLVDFWTYSCINCQRTFPYLKNWWSKYEDDGLVIIGVHAPEFEFEKNPENVKKALSDFGITYPIMQDNDFETWRAYGNRYWPAKYLINKDGDVVYTHFGEGKYDEMEKKIQELLLESGVEVKDEVNNQEGKIFSRTPEIYLGSLRVQYLDSPEQIIEGKKMLFSRPKNLYENYFAFEGNWTMMKEYSLADKGSKLVLNFEAKEVFLVARPKGNSGTIQVLLDEKYQAFGEDNKNGVVNINSDRLYKIINLPSAGRHELRIDFNDDQVEVYAFTFG
ncbi:cytochrome c biogenesis protein DipZ [Candidatus Curtissbacteria bacterium]|nr:cytochrome c biogenesis protein DipZ [Candidatus Curtissbacteria bacterium]